MKVAVTGGTGFIGRYVIEKLLKDDIDVVVIGRSREKAQKFDWFRKVDFIEFDLNSELNDPILDRIAHCDKLIHLAWDGLPNYKELFHFERNLMTQYFFLKALISKGLQDVTITGTCLEYGLREGALDVTMVPNPTIPYSIAKNALRNFLSSLKRQFPFNLKWIRLFYIYGEGQSPSSILSQLDRAIDDGLQVFDMSGGEQLRDYLSVHEVAKNIIEIMLLDDNREVFNCCSGQPISIRRLVENHMQKREKYISLNLAHYSYPDYEPMSFWGKK